MLVLSRHVGEVIEIEVAGIGVCRITVLKKRGRGGGEVSLAFDAPRAFVISRVEGSERRMRRTL